MSTDETRPLPLDATRPLPADGTAHDGTAHATTDGAAAARTADAHGTGTGTSTGTGTGTGTEDVTGRRDRVRVGTIVWGVVIALLGAGVLTVAAGYTIDLELAAIGLLVVAGLGLIVGPLVASARRGRSDEPAAPRG